MRVSTGDQDLSRQRLELREYCERRGWDEVEEFEDVVSGSSSSRVGLDEMMSKVRRGKLEVVLASHLDRLGRSLSHLVQMFGELKGCGCALVVPGQGIDTSKSNPAGELQMNILGAVSEFERGLIRERTVAGLAGAKARGVKLGRPMGSTSIPSRKKVNARRIWERDRRVSVTMLSGEVGVSRTTAFNWMKEFEGEVRDI